MKSTLSFDAKMSLQGLSKLQRESPKRLKASIKKAAVRHITGVINGEWGNRPPIKEGYLRGSFTAFVDGEACTPSNDLKKDFVAKTPPVKAGSEYNVVFVSSVPYAEKMETGDWKPGPLSAADGKTGNHFLKSAIDEGQDDFAKHLGALIKKELANL